jgi:hypothetical protein
MDQYATRSLNGHVVLIPVILSENRDLLPDTEEKLEDILVELHKKKIDMADKVIVLNINGYIGRGMYEEIGYATVKEKIIEYIEPIKNR